MVRTVTLVRNSLILPGYFPTWDAHLSVHLLFWRDVLTVNLLGTFFLLGQFFCRFVRPNYIFWSMVRTSIEDEEEGSSGEEDDEEQGHGRATSFGYQEDDFDIDEFDHALNKMSITPKNYKWGGDMQPLARMPSRLRPSTSPESL